MMVIDVVFIEINRFIGAFADFPEGYFTQPANFTIIFGIREVGTKILRSFSPPQTL